MFHTLKRKQRDILHFVMTVAPTDDCCAMVAFGSCHNVWVVWYFLVLQLSNCINTMQICEFQSVAADAVHSCSEGHCSRDQLNLLSDSNSPVWYRGYVQSYEAEICPEVQQVVQALPVQRIVSGHNIMQDGKIKTLCDGRLNLIDVGMSKAYFGNMAVWQCSNDSLAAIHPERTYRLKLPPQVPT